MALIDELKEKREEAVVMRDELWEAAQKIAVESTAWHNRIDELEAAIRGIEALRGPGMPVEPQPIPDEPELFEADKETAREQLEREDDASEFAELDLPPMDLERAEIILSLLTNEAPALNADMQDEREQPVEDGYAPVTNPEADAWSAPVETTPGTLAEYVPPTNPEADALAKAHDYYDPKAVADRDRNAGMARLFSYTPFHKPKVDA